MRFNSQLTIRRTMRFTVLLFVVACGFVSAPSSLAQQSEDNAAEAGVPTEELQRLAAEALANRNAPPAPEPNSLKSNSLNVLELLRQGGGIMAVIGVVSLLVVAVALERLFSLRSARLLPRGLRREIRRASENTDGFSPPELFAASVRYRSVASRILREMLLKVGRPISEVETALSEGAQREADLLYGNVRWLTLAAAITPLIGLLGTVWGMIIAFHDTTRLGAGTNRAEFLAEGIYVALVTTLGGLAVAIPAAIFAHYFEGRITKMLALIESELRRLIPRFESHEGRVRYDVNSQGLVRRDTLTDEASGHSRHAQPSAARAIPPPVQPARQS